MTAGKAIEERRFSGVRIADERDREYGLARFPLRLPGLLDPDQIFLEAGDACPHDPAVKLELCFTDSALRAPTRAASLSREVRPGPRQAWEHVFELRQFHLRPRLAAARPADEDLQDQ